MTAGATVSGISFQLDAGGIVSGVVTGGGSAPLAGEVTIYTRVGGFDQFAGSASTNPSTGAYAVAQLASGSYHALTNVDGHINEIYGDIPCLGSCSGTFAVFEGTAIGVTAGASTTNVNFALDAGGRIAGTVRRASNGEPLSGITVFAYTVTGELVTFGGRATSSASGAYEIGGLRTERTSSSPAGRKRQDSAIRFTTASSARGSATRS